MKFKEPRLFMNKKDEEAHYRNEIAQLEKTISELIGDEPDPVHDTIIKLFKLIRPLSGKLGGGPYCQFLSLVADITCELAALSGEITSSNDEWELDEDDEDDFPEPPPKRSKPDVIDLTQDLDVSQK